MCCYTVDGWVGKGGGTVLWGGGRTRDRRLEDGILPEEEESQFENTCWEKGRETDNVGTSRYIALLHQHPSVDSVDTKPLTLKGSFTDTNKSKLVIGTGKSKSVRVTPAATGLEYPVC
jgi:hypothetical protein